MLQLCDALMQKNFKESRFSFKEKLLYDLDLWQAFRIFNQYAYKQEKDIRLNLDSIKEMHIIFRRKIKLFGILF